MIKPLARQKVIDVTTPLPPVWIRREETTLNFAEEIGGDLLQVGRDGLLHTALLELIRDAKEVIVGVTFLLSDEEMAQELLAATERGVRVYLLTASEHRIATSTREGDIFSERMSREHKELLDRLAGKVLLRSAEHFHAKFLIADPQGETRGWLSTANFNLALKESVELALRLPTDDARHLAQWFNRAFWMEAEHELTSPGKLHAVSLAPEEPDIPARGNVIVTAKGKNSLRESTLRLVKSAEKELFVSSYGLDAEHPIIDEIAQKARDGVEVVVFTRPRPSVMAACLKLEQAGARVVAHDKLHAKAIYSDGKALIMSANLETSGLDEGFEAGVLLNKSTAWDLRGVLCDWANDFPWQFKSSCRPQEHLGEICLAEKGMRDGRSEVVSQISKTLPQLVADDALALKQAPEPDFKIPKANGKFPQSILFQWEVHPPRLPQKAKQRMQKVTVEKKGKDGKTKKMVEQQPYSPPVYDLSDQPYIAIKRNTDLDLEIVAKLAADLRATVVIGN